MRILLYTSNTSGGILQFTMTIMETLYDLGHDVKCMVPSKATFNADSRIVKDIIKYPSLSGIRRKYDVIGKTRDINHINKTIKKIVDDINPDLIWFTDNPLFTIKVGLLLAGKYNTILTLHDANTGHPGRMSIYQKLLRVYSLKLGYKLEDAVNNILLLSENSVTLFNKTNPEFKDKVKFMQLGAHIPIVDEEKPSELCVDKFHLFFGRIDEYKGLEILLESYATVKNPTYKLVIAGKGIFSEKEKQLLNNENVISINRYITDNEMVWLMKHAISTILPYKQATQSGVIPIAYQFGVPVIVSDTEGLTQNVLHKRTGYICRSNFEYTEAIKNTEQDNIRLFLSENAKHYSEQNFDWHKNVKHLLEEL